MVKNICKFLVIVALVALGTGCSTFNDLLKNPDKDYVYEQAIAYYEDGKYGKAIKLFTDIAPYFLTTMKEDSITYYNGCANYKSGDFGISSAIFDDFRRRFARSPFIEDVEYMYAMGYYYSAPRIERDQTSTQEAIYELNEYLNRYPESVKKDYILENIEELENRIYSKSFYSAYSYYKIRKYKSAVVALRNALNEYPESPHREEILYLITKSAYLLAKDSYDELQRDRYLSVMDYYYNYMAEFSDGKYVKELNRYEKETQAYLDKYDSVALVENAPSEDEQDNTEK